MASQKTAPDETSLSPWTLIPPKLLMAARPILDTFARATGGIWYVTPEDNCIIISASDNYNDRLNGEWYQLGSATMEGGLVVHWMIPCPAESFPGVWFVTDQDGNVISRSSNYEELKTGRWYELKTPRPNGETLHWMVKITS